MDPEQVTSTLQSTKFIQALPKELAGKVVPVLQEVSKLRTVPMGETWIQEGDKTDGRGFILVRGSVSIRRGADPPHTEEAPELLGEIMQFNPAHSRTASVVAMNDCVVMSFDWDAFWAKLQETLADDEVGTVKAAVESFAWEHFTR